MTIIRFISDSLSLAVSLRFQRGIGLFVLVVIPLIAFRIGLALALVGIHYA